jgi:hypothetical protein
VPATSIEIRRRRQSVCRGRSLPVTVTAPACPGIYEVKVEPTGVPNRYAAVADLEVT